MTDLSKAWSVILSTEQLAVETSHYSNWSDLRSRLEAALDAVTQLTTLRIRERAGLRYVNQITPGDSGSFRGRVRQEMLGPAGDEEWEKHVTSMLSQITAKDDETQLLLRVGLASIPPQNSGLSCLIDIDCFNDQPQQFELDETLKYFDQLNDISYRCFCWSVPAEYRAEIAVDSGSD
jgi:uncharacterized protein (TIGR04255 family)